MTRTGPDYPGRLCPYCGADNDSSDAVYDNRREPATTGDVSICAYCAEASVFADANGTVRKPTGLEEARLRTDAEVQRLRRVIREILRSRQRIN